MVRKVVVAIVVAWLVGGCRQAPGLGPVDVTAQRTEAAAAVRALQTGDFAGADAAATTALAADRANAIAAGVRALARYQRAGSHTRDDLLAALERSDRGFDHARFRAIWQRFADDLAKVEVDLAIAARPHFELELCLACWRHDWNHSGEIDDGDLHLLEVEVDATGAELAADDPRRRPTFRFDVGDVAWARAMVSFQRATLELVLAYRWTELDKLVGSLFSPELPTITIRLDDADRVRTARTLIEAGLAHADATRAAYLAETDDDREWVPSPRQHDHPVPLGIDQAVYDTWAGVIGDLRRLIAGAEGIAIAELAQLGDDQWTRPPTGFIDLRALLERPGDIVIDLRKLDQLGEAGRQDPLATAAVVRDLLGRAYVRTMKPSPLVGRLARMRDEVEHDEDTVERKLRYFLWLN